MVAPFEPALCWSRGTFPFTSYFSVAIPPCVARQNDARRPWGPCNAFVALNCETGVEDEAVPALGDDVEDINRPDLEVLRASEAKNCDLLIEIGGRMDEVCESCHKVF